ncbi:MAG TPA: hypothetical protein VFF72_10095 [Caldimonas sp.]|nr:hypothetical protein [Caldimonas sp.]
MKKPPSADDFNHTAWAIRCVLIESSGTVFLAIDESSDLAPLPCAGSDPCFAARREATPATQPMPNVRAEMWFRKTARPAACKPAIHERA